MDRPRLIILCGLPGSGKTTFAEKLIKDNIHRDNTIHLSSDKIRAELWSDENIQGDNSQVFSLMQSRAVDALNNGKNVIYDSTAMTRKDRAGIIASCPKFAEIDCYIVWAPIETCIERDAARERTVGKEVIDRMVKRFQAVWYDEGFDNIWVNCSVDNFDIVDYAEKIMNNMKIPHDNPHHTLDVYNHCVEAAKYAESKCGMGPIWYSAIWHDAGKPYVKAFINGKGEPSEHAHFYQHQCVSAYMSYGLESYLGFDYSGFLFAVWLISTHMDPYLNTKYYNKLPAYLKAQVDLLHEADKAAH